MSLIYYQSFILENLKKGRVREVFSAFLSNYCIYKHVLKAHAKFQDVLLNSKLSVALGDKNLVSHVSSDSYGLKILEICLKSNFVDTWGTERVILTDFELLEKVIKNGDTSLFILCLKMQFGFDDQICQWFTAHPRYVFNVKSMTILTIILERSGDLESASDITKILCQTRSEGVYKYDSKKHSVYLDRKCTCFVSGRLVPDPTWRNLARIIYQMNDSNRAYFLKQCRGNERLLTILDDFA